jgi:hypothetical protein
LDDLFWSTRPVDPPTGQTLYRHLDDLREVIEETGHLTRW